ncbi:MAG: hypothetical protein GY765_27865, partial [bacterium]|nr:hypothetical protein [bacterium]
KYKRVVRSCRKIRRSNLGNARIAIADARKLVSFIPDNSLHGVLAFFPDPWQKNKQRKHRFLNPLFFKEIYSKLSANGFVWIKTDCEIYYKDVLSYARSAGFIISNETHLPIVGDFHQTFFEEVSIKAQKPVYQVVVKMPPSRVHPPAQVDPGKQTP